MCKIFKNRKLNIKLIHISTDETGDIKVILERMKTQSMSLIRLTLPQKQVLII